MALEREVGAFAASEPESVASRPMRRRSSPNGSRATAGAALVRSSAQGQELMWAWAEDVVSSHAPRCARVRRRGRARSSSIPAEDAGLLRRRFSSSAGRLSESSERLHLRHHGAVCSTWGACRSITTRVAVGGMPRQKAEAYPRFRRRRWPQHASVGQRSPSAEIDAIDLSGSMLQCLLWNARKTRGGALPADERRGAGL